MGTIKSAFFWNLYSYIYDLMLFNPPYQKMQQQVVNELNFKNNSFLLDAGCGTGNFEKSITRFKNDKFIQIKALDSSSAMLRRAAKKIKKESIDYQNQDINESLLFGDNYFDYITAINVIYSINNPENVLQEFFRVLKNGGKIIIVNPEKKANPKEFFKAILNSAKGIQKIVLLFTNLPLFLFNFVIALKGKNQIYHFWEREKWIDVLSKLGYHKITVTPIYIQGYLITAYK